VCGSVLGAGLPPVVLLPSGGPPGIGGMSIGGGMNIGATGRVVALWRFRWRWRDE